MRGSSLFLVLTLCANVAFAEQPASPSSEAGKAAAALVQKQLVARLTKAESKRRRFSRSAPVAVERRVRVLDEVALIDARGKSFVRFAIDVRRGWDDDDKWQTSVVLGCAYPDERRVFVKRGDAYLPAGSMLGEDAKAVRDVCRAAPSTPAA